MSPRWFLVVVLALMTVPVSAQRVFSTIDPTEVDDTLKFDVNLIPAWPGNVETPRAYKTSIQSTTDLNFCPNVVFSPDSTKGFVSYPGSDKVMAFNPKTGEITALLEVGLNPGQLSISPDGRTVVGLSLFLARNTPKGPDFSAEEVATLFAIDVDTLEVRTLDLTQVWFSFFNNLVFSADGQKVFVASMRTDEILRIDVATLTEISPRLQFSPGSWPASLTMAPDGSYFMAVLIGSPSLDRIAHPDSIAVINPTQFQVTRTLSPPTGAQEQDQDYRYPQDFTAMNNVALSADGKYGIIGDEAYSSVVLTLPESTRDRVWVFNVETGDFQLYLAYAPVTGVYTLPDGRFFVFGGLYYTFIDPEAKTSAEVAPLFTYSEFLPRNNPAFSADGQLMYFAVPYYDRLLSYNLSTNVFPGALQIGGTVDLSDTFSVTSAPMQLQFTPDHQVLVAVDFNANKLELIENTTHFSIDRFLSDDAFFTGVALTNPSSQDANVIVTGYGNSGLPLVDNTDTEDVVEYVNPVEVSIPAGGQLAKTAAELLSIPEGQASAGWMDVDTDQADLRSFSLIGDRGLKRLDGVVASRSESIQYIVPEVRVTDGFDTQLVILNRNLQATHVVLQLFSNAGELLGTSQLDLARRGSAVQYLRDPDPTDDTVEGLFPETIWEDFEDGYVVVTSATGVTAFERYVDSERMSVLDCTPIGERDPHPTRFFLPQIVEFQGNSTTLKLINSHPIPPEEPTDGSDPIDPETLKLTVQLELKGNDGQDLAAPVTVDLGAGESIRQSVAELFGLEDPGAVVSGWLLIDVNQEGLVGSAEFQVFGGKGMSTIPLQAAGSQELIFSHVAQGLGLSTGLVLINPGDTAATATVQVFRQDGELNAGTELQIPAGGRIAGLLSELLDGMGEQIGGYVKVTSDSDLIGLELFYADSLEYIAAVGAQ